MIIFLRNQNNRTILDLDCYVKTEYEANESRKFVEVSADVSILYYSKFLLENLDKKEEIIQDFYDMSELRGWLWERYFMGGDNDPEKYDDVIKELRTMIKGYASKYNLRYVED
jgi:hypothetical protein